MRDTEAGKTIGFALEQPLHVVALPCSALRILKRLQQRMKIKNSASNAFFITNETKVR
ncbi:MAG: hypothetical protein LBK06_06920 [Planctomycetaceae bacterium]|nr:hypothetical protein [Planctomycetaceae bacterium]